MLQRRWVPLMMSEGPKELSAALRLHLQALQDENLSVSMRL